MIDLNYNLYRLKYRYGKHLNLTRPVDVCLELSSACNMSCSYCYHGDPKSLPFKRGFMDYHVAIKALGQMYDLGVNSFKPNYRGEATLHPQFKYIVNYAKLLSKGSTLMDRVINSNFKFLPKKRDDVFEGLSHMTKVKVSYDSFRKDVFETQRAGGDHDLTTQNIDLFYNHPFRLKSETQLVIQAVKTKLNKDEDLNHLIKKRWPEAQVSVRDMVTGRVGKDLSKFTHKRRNFDNRKSCLQAHVRLIVHHDGKVSPCCPSIKNDLIVGSFPYQNLEEIFNSESVKLLRKNLLNKHAFSSDPCKTCPSHESFKGYKHPWKS